MASLPVVQCPHVAVGSPLFSRWLNNDTVQDLCQPCDASALDGIRDKLAAHAKPAYELEFIMLTLRTLY